MKIKKLKKLIQRPLKRENKLISKELDDIKEKLNHVICQMQKLQCRIDQYEQTTELWVSEYDDTN
jgi:hypothetical protein